MSRQSLSRANQLFAGKATLGNYQTGKPGGEVHALYRFKPAGLRAVVFTGALAAGAVSGTLNANWGGASGVFPITFSDGEVLNGIFTNGATTCPFLPGSFPQAITSTGAYGQVGFAGLVNAVTANATAGGQPPILGVAAGYSASASIGAGANAVLGGTLSTGGVGIADVPRNVVGAWTTSSTVTVTGTDFYGYPQTEAQTGTTFTGKKAFATVTQITSSAAVTAATFGTGNVLGLPFAVRSGDFLSPMFLDAADASTFTAADVTAPATNATGDVRGTVAPAGTLNGAKFYSCLIKPVDPSVQVQLFGVPPA
jgi:hypothetical protein